jgi:hypothetical protein
MTKSTIYILELENNKYYIGRSNCSKKRILQHFNNNGSEWTKLYKPIRILSQFKGDSWDEEKHTLITMNTYGVNNVRGGSYCKIHLTESEKEKAMQTILSVMDKCYKCGEPGHFANECSIDKFEQKEDVLSEHDIAVIKPIDEECKSEQMKDMVKSDKYKFVTKLISIVPFNFGNYEEIIKMTESMSPFDDILINNEEHFNMDERQIIYELDINNVEDLIRNNNISVIDKTRCIKCLKYVRFRYELLGIEPVNGHISIKLFNYLICIRILPNGLIKYCKSLGELNAEDFYTFTFK